jgi:hypothetical protein
MFPRLSCHAIISVHGRFHRGRLSALANPGFFQSILHDKNVAMCRPLLLVLLVLLCFAVPPRLRSQEAAKAKTPPAQSRAAGTPKLDYPDSTSGLERLAKDIIQAQKENAGALADALLHSLLLPNPRAWYEMTFGPVIAKFEGALYESVAASIHARRGLPQRGKTKFQPPARLSLRQVLR